MIPLKIGVLLHKTLCFSAPAWYDSHSTLPPTQAGLRSAPVSAPAAPAATPAPAASAAPAAGEQICAPMPGNILAVNVTAGQAVKKGDVLMVLEAMKMENEIMCPRDGVVASVNTSKGASVESGTLLCVLQ